MLHYFTDCDGAGGMEARRLSDLDVTSANLTQQRSIVNIGIDHDHSTDCHDSLSRERVERLITGIERFKSTETRGLVVQLPAHASVENLVRCVQC